VKVACGALELLLQFRVFFGLVSQASLKRLDFVARAPSKLAHFCRVQDIDLLQLLLMSSFLV
jgi:hypothetical protein